MDFLPNNIITAIETASDELENSNAYYGQGIDNPWDEAVQLVLHVMQLPLDSDRSISENPINAEHWSKISKLLSQRIEKHIPVAYLIHEAWFMQKPFYVDERVLIPRSPFGEWLTKRFEPYIKPEKIKRILEIGTGSGCMSIGAAWQFPQAQVDAVDISPDALAVAKINLEKYHLSDRINLIESDCFPKNKVIYDLIISNPPYVPESEYQDLPHEFYHEPKLALTAPQQGMQIVERILKNTPLHLSDDGVLVLEVGASIGIFKKQFPKLKILELALEHGGNGLMLIRKADLIKFNSKP